MDGDVSRDPSSMTQVHNITPTAKRLRDRKKERKKEKGQSEEQKKEEYDRQK
jgi:hypothetical protein